MAIINAPSLQDVIYSGDCPAAHAHGYVTLANAQVGDVVRLNRVYAGTKIYSDHFVNAALGAGVTVSLGYEYVNGEAAAAPAGLIAATGANAAGRVNSVHAPITLQYDAFITATIGGAAATGKLDSVVNFEFKGK